LIVQSVREDRAKKRGSFNQAEWNRRLITDDQDFASEKVAKVCNFKVANYNKKLYNVVKEIESDIKIWKS
jgi:guanylate kinase